MSIILTEDELLAILNSAPGVQIERRTFGRYIRPLMIKRKEAKQAAKGRTQPWVYDARDMWQWCEYLAVRARMIGLGKWSEKRAYSLADLDEVVHLDTYAEVRDALFPIRGGGQP